MPAVNPFFCFLKSYRDQCGPSAQRSQKVLAEEAGKLWRTMSTEQRAPYVQMAQQNKKAPSTPFSSGEESEDPTSGSMSDKILTSERYQRELEAEKRRLKRHCCSTTRGNPECHSPQRMPVQEDTPAATDTDGKSRVQRLLECLFCRCEKGEYARGLLFELGRRANDCLPDMGDEQFFIYYKVLITSLLGMGLFTLGLSVWHYYQ